MLQRAFLLIGIPIMLTHAAYNLAGCAGVLPAIDEVNDPQDDNDLKRCRQEMRAAKDAGADAGEAYRVYYDCTVEAGLR